MSTTESRAAQQVLDGIIYLREENLAYIAATIEDAARHLRNERMSCYGLALDVAVLVGRLKEGR